MSVIGDVTFIHMGMECDVEWKMDFRALSKKDGAYYCSPEFSFEGKNWYLGIWPNGIKSRDSAGFIDLRIERRPYNGPPMKVEFSFAIKSVNGQKVFLERQETGDFFCDIYRFISKSDFEKRQSELVASGSLTLVFTLKKITSTGSSSGTAIARCSFCKKDVGTENVSKHEKKCLYRLIKCPDCLHPVQVKWLHKHECKKKRTEECSYCKKNVDVESISTHQKKCMDRPIKCPECSEVVLLQKWYGHECQARGAEDNIQLKDQLLAVYEELAKEKNEKENLKSAILTMEKTICELQSITQDNVQLNNVVETLFKENGKERKFLSDHSEANSKKAGKKFKKPFRLRRKKGATEISTTEENINIEVLESNETTISRSNQDNAIKTKESVSFSPEDYSIVANANHLLKERKSIDVTFVLETSDGEKEVFAHQLVLAVRSSFFADEFYSKEINKEHQIIPLKGIDAKTFEKMIRYCYDCELGLKTIEEACALFKIASEFRVVSLVNLCCKFLKFTKIEPGSVFSVLEVSEKMNDNSLRDMCFKVLEENTEEVMASHELCDVTPSMVHRILDLQKLSLNSEYHLIHWIFEWAKVKSKKEDSICENAREYLEKLLQNMNFQSLTAEEFGMLCKVNPEFFSSDEMTSISMNIASTSLNITLPGMRKTPDWYGKDMKLRVYTGSKE